MTLLLFPLWKRLRISGSKLTLFLGSRGLTPDGDFGLIKVKSRESQNLTVIRMSTGLKIGEFGPRICLSFP